MISLDLNSKQSASDLLHFSRCSGMGVRKRTISKVSCFSLLTVYLLICIASGIDAHRDRPQSLDDENSEEQMEVRLNECENCDCGGWRSGRPSPIPDISDACQEVLQHFSDSVANFSWCLAMNARPITVCQDCIGQYLQVNNWYNNISSGAGASCDTQLLNRDHLQVVKTLAKQAEWYWNTAQCPNCYFSSGDGPPELCNDTRTFFDKLTQVNNCINKTQTVDDKDHVIKNQSQVCDQCLDDYIHLNEFYESLNTKYNNRLCMDVMDAMNITRHLWSSTYMCTKLQVESMPVLLSSFGFLLLPVMYYFGNRFIASAKDTTLLKQKRMSFVQTSYSSASLQR